MVYAQSFSVREKSLCLHVLSTFIMMDHLLLSFWFISVTSAL